MVLQILAKDLFTRYALCAKMEDLDEPILLVREALALWPPWHLHRPVLLRNLAFYLYTRYSRLGGAEDLNEAILLTQEAQEFHQRVRSNHWASN